MTPRHRAVAVKQLPETFDAQQGRRFFSELESSMNVDRPSLVLDCSRVRLMDTSAVHLLLCCLEEAMKRNGDVKLAGLSDTSIEVLDRTGVLNLFECYNSTTEAVRSFHRISIGSSHASAELHGSAHQSEPAVQVA